MQTTSIHAPSHANIHATHAMPLPCPEYDNVNGMVIKCSRKANKSFNAQQASQPAKQTLAVHQPAFATPQGK